MAVVQKRYAGAEILCIRTEDEKRMIIKCHACAENQGEPDVAIMGVVQKRYACADICIRKIPPFFCCGWFCGFCPGPGGRGCLLIRNRDRDRAAVALELATTQDLSARGARGARGARVAMCRDSMHQNRR